MRSDKGLYKRKHPDNTSSDPQIVNAVQEKHADGKIRCIDAEEIAASVKKPMGEVGTVIDLLETSIVQCQLGLFGYGKEKRIVTPSATVPPDREKSLRMKLINGCLPCYVAWELAEKNSLPRMNIAADCEALGIKIIACQLGAF